MNTTLWTKKSSFKCTNTRLLKNNLSCYSKSLNRFFDSILRFWVWAIFCSES